mgnify:CR=1 FL=1
MHNLTNQAYLEKLLPAGAKKPIPVIHDAEDPFEEFKGYVAGTENAKLPVYNTIHHMLTNPVYGGAYAFGRRIGPGSF